MHSSNLHELPPGVRPSSAAAMPPLDTRDTIHARREPGPDPSARPAPECGRPRPQQHRESNRVTQLSTPPRPCAQSQPTSIVIHAQYHRRPPLPAAAPCTSRWIVLALLATAAAVQAADKTAALRASQSSGFYIAPFELTLSSPTGGAILFTTDGRVPTPGTAAPYRGPLRIERTTVLRASSGSAQDTTGAAAGLTRTYIFPDDVRRQTGAGLPRHWGVTNGVPVAADYEMDPEIVAHPVYGPLLAAAMRSLPLVSLVVDPEDLFGAERGIYANPLASGAAWERPGAVEIVFPHGVASTVRAPCGVRIQGGWNRRPEESPKHAFRLEFRKKYGAGKLKAPLFSEAGPEAFDTLILRAGCNNTWLHWSGEERRRGDFIRDQWMRDTYRAMGNLSARGRFVHLFLNGLYWGLYNLTERPDAAFLAGHLGGKPEDYESRNGQNLIEGDAVAWERLFAWVNAGITNDAAYAQVRTLLDVPRFIDFILLNLYGANSDWDRVSNWYAGRRRDPRGQFLFLIWDGERTLEDVAANTLEVDDDQSPLRLFQKLRRQEPFRREFADRARAHLAGALSADASAQRFRKLAAGIDLAVVAESARWGDYRRDVHRYKVGPYALYTRDEFWRPEVDRILTGFFPERARVLGAQLTAAGFPLPP